MSLVIGHCSTFLPRRSSLPVVSRTPYDTKRALCGGSECSGDEQFHNADRPTDRRIFRIFGPKLSGGSRERRRYLGEEAGTYKSLTNTSHRRLVTRITAEILLRVGHCLSNRNLQESNLGANA
jgi:hypothetical protein